MDTIRQLFISIDKLLSDLSSKGVTAEQLSLIQSGKLSPLGALGYPLEEDNDVILFRRTSSDEINNSRFQRNKLLPYFQSDDERGLAFSSLDYLCENMIASFQNHLNYSKIPLSDYYLKKYYSYSRSLSICTFKYRANNSSDSDLDTLIFCKMPKNSVYFRVYYKPVFIHTNNGKSLNNQDFVLIRIPFRELGSKECIVNCIVNSLPAGMGLENVCDILIWDVTGSVESLRRKRGENVSFCAAPQKDLEHLSSFVPDNSLILEGKEVIQLLKIYLLSLVCKFDLVYRDRLYSCLNNLCSYSDYYPKKIPMIYQSRLALRGILDYLNDPSNVEFERKLEFFNHGKESKILHFLDRYNCYSYLNRTLYLSDQNFDKVFLSWVYKNILKVGDSL